jgi:hypothetical protein
MGPVLKDEKTHCHHHPPRGLSHGREHAGREVRLKRESQAGLCQGRDAGFSRGHAGGAALADT